MKPSRSINQIILALAVFAACALPSMTQADPRAETPLIYGSYMGSFTLGNPNPLPFTTFPTLMTFHADGTLVETDGASLVDSPPGQPPNYSSAGHGLWEQVGPHTFQFKFISLSVGSDGTLVFSVVVTATVELTRDGTLRGQSRYQAYDASGAAISGLNGTSVLRAQRITL
jgi:hypothetical protein